MVPACWDASVKCNCLPGGGQVYQQHFGSFVQLQILSLDWPGLGSATSAEDVANVIDQAATRCRPEQVVLSHAILV